MSNTFISRVTVAFGISEAEARQEMATELKACGMPEFEDAANIYVKSVLLTAEELERENFLKWMGTHYPKEDLTMLGGEFESNTTNAQYAGWFGRAMFGGLILQKATLLEHQRNLFEEDARKQGFDLTRTPTLGSKRGMMPFDEYVNDETGHRWAGWLARSLNG